MRIALILGMFLMALLIPFSSFTPTWLGNHTTASEAAPGSPTRDVRLRSEIGVIPVESEESSAETPESAVSLDLHSAAASDQLPTTESDSPTIECKDGVCRIVDTASGDAEEASEMPATEDSASSPQPVTWGGLVVQLCDRGVQRYQMVATTTGQYRVTCRSGDGAKTRRHSASGASDVEAMQNLIRVLDEN